MQKIISFLSEVRLELKKVTWPKQETVLNYLSLVLIISIVVAIFVGTVDYGLTKTLESFLSKK